MESVDEKTMLFGSSSTPTQPAHYLARLVYFYFVFVCANIERDYVVSLYIFVLEKVTQEPVHTQCNQGTCMSVRHDT